MKYLGCAYYPEYWGVERVAADAQLMQEAGINLVRIGEFAWCRMEPEEGRFTLDWLHQTVQILGQHGINVMLCTPTATPPAWLTFTYPDTLLVGSDGRRAEHGGRRHYCYSSDTYRRHTRRIVEKLSTEFCRYPNVVAWQIDNEPDFGEKGICQCEICQARFQGWLKERYGTIDALNQRWGTGFWSMDYSDWRQVRLGQPGHYSSRRLDTYRFASQILSDFILFQAQIIKKKHPQAVVSTNLNGGLFTALDYYRIFDQSDVAYKDLYFDICTMDVNALIMDQFRSFKPGQKYWVTETGAGMCGYGRPSHPGQFKAWMWSSYAHGADAHVVFRWRTCLSGQEQELEGMVEHSGHPGHRYRAVQDAFHEMQRLSAALGDLPLPKAEVAMVHAYDVMWAYQSAEIGREIQYEKIFCDYHKALYQRNVLVDVIPPAGDLSQYRLVVLPSLMIIDAAFAERLQVYLNGGGVVLAMGQLGMRDANDNYLTIRGPQHLQDTFGVLINGGMYLQSCVAPEESWTCRTNFTVSLQGQLGENSASGAAAIWLGDLVNIDARVLLAAAEDTYLGQPAVVEKANGSGLAIYCAAVQVNDALLGRIFDYTLDKAGVDHSANLPEHVEIIRRGAATFVINHRDEALTLDMGIKGQVMRGSLENGIVSLQPYDVLIVTR